MKNRICETFGIELPLLAFSHQRDVVAAVTNAGGMGVLGCSIITPEDLEADLSWIDEQTGGKPYGCDVIIAGKYDGKTEHRTHEEQVAAIPQEALAWRDKVLREHDIDPALLNPPLEFQITEDANQKLLDVIWRHEQVKLVANALGVPPQFFIDQAHEHGLKVGALVGAKEHAVKQAQAGVDIIIAQGHEAGGHTGEISTLVLVPEVIAAVERIRPEVMVLAAGGIVTGRQMAAAIALGADGVWCGTVWLLTEESETNPVIKQKYIAASSRDTLRSRSRTGKPSRQLKSDWTAAYEPEAGGPGPLPMPGQRLIAEPVFKLVDKLAQTGHEGAIALENYFVGQGIGLLDQVKPAKQVVYEFAEDYLAAAERLAASLDD